MGHHEGTKDTKGTKEKALEVSYDVVGAAIEVHRHLGPGLLESLYQAALFAELRFRGLDVRKEVSLPLHYKEIPLGASLRLDMVVEDSVVVEVKSVEALAPIHRSQLLTYLKLTGHHVGLLINFNVELLRHGLRRILNG
jgi:GxxExxY protein